MSMTVSYHFPWENGSFSCDDKYQDGNTDGDDGVERISESHGRRETQDQISYDSAAYCGGKAQDRDAEYIHLLFKPQQGSRYGKSYGTDYFK